MEHYFGAEHALYDESLHGEAHYRSPGLARRCFSLALGAVLSLGSCVPLNHEPLLGSSGKTEHVLTYGFDIDTEPSGGFVEYSLQLGNEKPDPNSRYWIAAGKGPVKNSFMLIHSNEIPSKRKDRKYHIVVASEKGLPKVDGRIVTEETAHTGVNKFQNGFMYTQGVDFDPRRFPYYTHLLIKAQKPGFEPVIKDVKGFPPKNITIPLKKKK